MSTTNDDNFDYPAYTRENTPEQSNLRRGIALRQERVENAMKRPAIRVESEILNQFQAIAAPNQSAEEVINLALREWLATKDLKEMIRAELHDAVQEAFIQVGVDLPRLKAEIH